MEDLLQSNKPNPNPNWNNRSNSTNPRKKKNSEFEFCKVCKRNHNEGQRHKYFPSHIKSLSNFLSKFQTKVSEIRFFLKNPSILHVEYASRNRFWCVFCDSDIDELGSFFTCNNAINHLASVDHVKKLKHFMWKYGGGMDHVDTFRILETDLAKWEKKCKSLQSEAGSSSRQGLLLGPSNDIHNELNFENMNNFEKDTIHPINSNISNVVIPLQYYTNEYQLSHSGLSEDANIGSNLHVVTSTLPADTCSASSPWNSNDLMVNRNKLCNRTSCSANVYLSGEGMYQVSPGERVANREISSQGLQSITQGSSMALREAGGNVHSGAPPPWFEMTEGDQQKQNLSSFISLNKSGKCKLNPKRVGAAWAEKRKMEMEMEKRGEIVRSEFDSNWLPNFGRVWQSGTRKESRKEFEIEKQKQPKAQSVSEVPMKIQPYISKRMRSEASEGSGDPTCE